MTGDDRGMLATLTLLAEASKVWVVGEAEEDASCRRLASLFALEDRLQVVSAEETMGKKGLVGGIGASGIDALEQSESFASNSGAMVLEVPGSPSVPARRLQELGWRDIRPLPGRGVNMVLAWRDL